MTFFLSAGNSGAHPEQIGLLSHDRHISNKGNLPVDAQNRPVLLGDAIAVTGKLLTLVSSPATNAVVVARRPALTAERKVE